MDKGERLVTTYEEFSKDLNFYDPVDQEIYILSLNKDFQELIKKFREKHKIVTPPHPFPTNLSYYPLNIQSLFSYSEHKNSGQLEDDFMDIVRKTKFKNTRYSLSLMSGLIFYILYGQLRRMKRPDGETPIPPVKIAMKTHSRLGVKETIRITLDLFVDTKEDEVRNSIHKHWKFVEATQNKLTSHKGVNRPGSKDTIIRDSYILYLSENHLNPKDITEKLPNDEMSPNDISKRIIAMKDRVKHSFLN